VSVIIFFFQHIKYFIQFVYAYMCWSFKRIFKGAWREFQFNFLIFLEMHHDFLSSLPLLDFALIIMSKFQGTCISCLMVSCLELLVIIVSMLLLIMYWIGKKMLIVFQIFSESRIVEYSVKEKAMSPEKQEVQNFFCNLFSLFFQGLVIDTDFWSFTCTFALDINWQQAEL